MPAAKPAAPLAALKRREAVTFASVPDGMVGKVLGDLAADSGGRLVFVARDGQRLAEVERTIRFFAPDGRDPRFPGLGLPALRPRLAAIRRSSRRAWRRCRACRAGDRRRRSCSPRSTPSSSACPTATSSRGDRCRLRRRHVSPDGRHRPLAGGQRLPAQRHRARARRICGARRHPRPLRGRARTSRSASTSSATRWRPIRSFDPETQRTHRRARKRIDLVPASEMLLTPESIARFRERYVVAVRRRRPRRPALPVGERGPALCRHGALAAALRRRARDAVRPCRRCAGRPRPPRRRGGRPSGSTRSPTTTRRGVQALDGKGMGGSRALQAAAARSAST